MEEKQKSLEKFIPLSFSIQRKYAELLRVISEKSGLSISYIIAEALRTYLPALIKDLEQWREAEKEAGVSH